MGAKDKDKSLLEIAVELLNTKHKPQKIMAIAKEVMEIKGLKTSVAKETMPQFLADFMESGYFVYCGDDCWDLKERQATSVLDKDGSDYEALDDDEDVKKNELKDDYEDSFISNRESDDDLEDDEDSSDKDEEDDEFSSLLGSDGDSENSSDDSTDDDLDEEIDDDVETGYEEDEKEEE